MNAPVNKVVVEPTSKSWQAQLALRFENRNGKNRLTSCLHQGPLRVQRAFYPEGAAVPHVYLLHPPGGFVAGDELTIDIAVNNKSQGLVTTPSAGRVYRTNDAGLLQKQTVTGHVAESALLEWLPQENIIFNKANGLNQTAFYLAETANLVAWDICCLGRPAGEQPFVSGAFVQSLQVYRQQQLKLNERIVINGDSDVLSGRWALQGFTVFATLIATVNNDVLLRELKQTLQHSGLDYRFAFTQKGEFLIARYLGHGAIQARKLFTSAWQQIRPLLDHEHGRAACEPRIWHT